MTTAQTEIGSERTRVLLATSAIQSFISFWRAPRLYSVTSVFKHRTARSRTKASEPRSRVSTNWSPVLCCCVVLATSAALRAQQTIFNVPNADVLNKGEVYAELDVPFKTNSDPGNVVPQFSSFVPRVVIGAGAGVELGLNVIGNVNPGPDLTTLVLAIKWKIYDGRENGWAIVLGYNVFFPVRNKSYDIGNYSYAQASKTFKTKTRITFGGYYFSDNVVADEAQRAGGQFGFEQPVTSKFSFAADWYTGKHTSGYFTPGIIFKPHPRVTGYAGYSLGNANLRDSNHFFLLELGYNFN